MSAGEAPKGPARVLKLALDGATKKRRYVIETRVVGGGQLGVILIGLKSPDRVLVSKRATSARLSAEEFVCADEETERALIEAGGIRVVRTEGNERVCALWDGEEQVVEEKGGGSSGGFVADVPAGESSRGVVVGKVPPKTMTNASDQDVLGMLGSIMKGRSPRILSGGGGGNAGGGASSPSASRAPSTSQGEKRMSSVLTPRTTRGGQAHRSAASSASKTPSGTGAGLDATESRGGGAFGSTPPNYYSSAFSGEARQAAGGAAPVDDYIENMMSDFAGLLGGDLAKAPRANAGLPLGFDLSASSSFTSADLEKNTPQGADRGLSPFFSMGDSSGTGALAGALEDGVDVAPMEDTSGLYSNADEVNIDQLRDDGDDGSNALGLDATPSELRDLLNRSNIVRSVEQTLVDSAFVDDYDHDAHAAAKAQKQQLNAPAGEICQAFNLRRDSVGCSGCVNRHVCELCESPRHPYGKCPMLYMNVNKRTEKQACVEYYLNSADNSGAALRAGWNQVDHTLNICPRGSECMFEHVCASCGKVGTNQHLKTCRLYNLFAKPAPIDLCRKYYLHSCGDYFKMESDSQKFKVGGAGGWTLCGKGDRCHSRHICGLCGEEGRGKHKPECKLHPICTVIPPPNKTPCFLYFMKSMSGIREFEKGLLGGSSRGFCSTKKGSECSGYHVCGFCSRENVSPYKVEGHDASCRMRSIVNETDPTLNPRMKQLLKDYEDEMARVREAVAAKATASAATATGTKAASKAPDAQVDDVVPVDVKRCRVLKTEIDAIIRGIADEIDTLCFDAVENAGKEMKKSVNPTSKMEKIRESLG